MDLPTKDLSAVKSLSKYFSRLRNSVVFYWKSANLICSPTVFYSLTERNRARGSLKRQLFSILGLKVHKIVSFGLKSFKVSTKTIRLLAFVFYQRQSTRLRLVDYSLIENSGSQSDC